LRYEHGFKRRDGEHILRVDVHRPGASNTHFVKLAGHERLAAERDCWRLCRLTDSNPVFMPLTAIPDPIQPDQIGAIVYQDAEAHIGAERSRWLETAVRWCVRFSSPTAPSVCEVIRDLYSQVCRLYLGAELK